MRIGWVALTALAFAAGLWCEGATAADLGVGGPRASRAARAHVCQGHGCYRGCPDGVSCYPLYGAYGPYGGRAYWSAYTPRYYDYR